jgi:hypothetical protein
MAVWGAGKHRRTIVAEALDSVNSRSPSPTLTPAALLKASQVRATPAATATLQTTAPPPPDNSSSRRVVWFLSSVRAVRWPYDLSQDVAARHALPTVEARVVKLFVTAAMVSRKALII